MSKPLRVLIVEDSEDDMQLVLRELKRGEYDPTYERVDTQEGMAQALERQPWDIVLADWAMPHFSGLGALMLHKEKGLDLPFIIVSGSIGEETAVAGMKAGANDYVLKSNLNRLTVAIERELADAEVRRARRQAEEALKASEEKYRRLFERAVAGVFRSTVDGKMLDCNEAFARIFGYASREEVLAESAWNLYFKREDRQSYNERLRERGSVAGDELRLRRKDGQAVYVLTNASLAESPEGKRDIIEGTLADITERKKAEEQLRSAEQNFRNSLDSSPLGIRIATADGKLLYANKAILDISGYSSVEELEATPAKQRFTPESYAGHLKRIEALRLGQPVPSNYQIDIVRQDGKIRHLNVYRREVIWNGEVQSQGIYEDITERKQTGRKLEQAAEEWRTTFDSITDWISIVDRDFRLVRVNRAFADALKMKPKEVLGKTCYELIHKTKEPIPNCPHYKTLETKRTANAELFEPNLGIHLEMSTSPVFNEKGEVLNTVHIARDITERKKMEEHLRSAERSFRNSLDSSPLGIRIATQDGKLLYANKAMLDISGYSSVEELEATPAEQRYTPESYAEHLKRIEARRLGQPIPSNYTISIVHKDGKIRHLNVFRKEVIWNGEVQSQGIYEDTTERVKADEAFRRISTFNQSLLDSLPFGMDIVDEKGTILYLSKRLESVLGKGAIGKKCWDILKDNRKQCDSCPWKGEIKIGEVKTIEVSGVLAGRTFQVAHTGIMYQGKKALLKIHNDITERKQAEQSLSAKTTELARRVQELEGVNRLNVQILNERVKTGEDLQQRNKELEILMAITHSMAQLQEPDKILQVALDKVLAFLELKRGFTALLDEEKNKFSFLCHRGFPPPMAQQLEQASPDRGFIGLALRGTQPIMIEDIGTRPTEVQSQVGPEPGPHSLLIGVLKGRGKALGVISVSSSRQRLFTSREKDLLTAIAGQIGIALDNSHLFQQTRQSEEKYRQLVDNLHEGIWVLDKDSCTTFVNPSMTEMLGYKTDEMLGRQLFSFMDEQGVKLATQLLARRKEGVKEQHEFEFLRKDGTRAYVILETSPITDKDGNYIGAIAGVQDITGRRKMEEQLIMQDRLASIGQLASGIAHELNNPLTAVIGFSEMLLERDLPEDVKEDLETVNREAKRTANVVKGLLTFVRKQGTEKALVDFNGTIQGVLQLRSYEQKVSNIEVNARFAPDLPQVMGNGAQLQQVFINIIVNAEQAMLEAHGRGKLTITTERVGDIVRASIADDGPGISPENMRKLFSPFFTTKEVGKGTGLGLSICHGIVTEHGGKIYAESEPAKGATFVVELPISNS